MSDGKTSTLFLAPNGVQVILCPNTKVEIEPGVNEVMYSIMLCVPRAVMDRTGKADAQTAAKLVVEAANCFIPGEPRAVGGRS